MDCQEAQRWLDDEAPPELREGIDSHCRQCPTCRALFAEAAAIESVARDMVVPDRPQGEWDQRRRRIVERVLARRRWGWRVAAAACVLLLLGVGMLVFRSPYPAPQASGDYVIAGGGTLGRSAVVQCGPTPAVLALGGYAKVEMEPAASLEIRGQPRQEAVFLRLGGVTCDVEPKRGQFAVQTEMGTVSVKGTKFTVRVQDQVDLAGDDPMLSKSMFVKVFAGAVLATGSWGQTTLYAGEERTLAELAGGKAAPGDAGARPGVEGPIKKWREGRMLELQKSLGVTDEQFKTLRPLIEKVQGLQGQQRSQPVMVGAGAAALSVLVVGGDGQPKVVTGPGAEEPQTELGKKLKELKDLADKADARPDDIKAKMEEVRKLREQIRKDLGDAQGELKRAATVKQEAVLLVRGVLE